MKGIIFTTDETMRVMEFAEPLYQSLGDAVGGFIEVVHPRGLEREFCMICNEEGILRALPINPIGCVWYGTMEHGCPIVGDIVIMKTGITEDGTDIVGLTDEEISKVKALASDISSGRISDLDGEECADV